MHVEFYLYGARDMRNRIENILRERNLENIYFLDYEKKTYRKFRNLTKN